MTANKIEDLWAKLYDNGLKNSNCLFPSDKSPCIYHALHTIIRAHETSLLVNGSLYVKNAA